MTMDVMDVWTTRQAADVLGVHPKHVNYLIRVGTLTATKHDTPRGPVYLIPRHAVEQLAQQMQAQPVRRGRKKR
jgi:excisionase family DNA binding protein